MPTSVRSEALVAVEQLPEDRTGIAGYQTLARIDRGVARDPWEL